MSEPISDEVSALLIEWSTLPPWLAIRFQQRRDTEAAKAANEALCRAFRFGPIASDHSHAELKRAKQIQEEATEELERLAAQYRTLFEFLRDHRRHLRAGLPNWPLFWPEDEAAAIKAADSYARQLIELDAAIAADNSPAIAGQQGQAAPAKKPKRPSVLPNANRDAYIARQREKKSPPTWGQIYDDIRRLAGSRGWSVPESAKALSEAYTRYLKRQRKPAA